MTRKKQVLILYTGGTIGMKPSRKGFVPAPGFLAECLRDNPLLRHPSIPEFIIKEYKPLIDSSNMRPDNWVQIAKDIHQHYQEYDGFIVLHGTDTLAYTASALSFMLKNLDKPVICTGAQIPISELRTDAVKHILDSLLLIAEHRIPEVCVYFDNVLLRGNRSLKIDTTRLHAFGSPNYPALAHVGAKMEIYQENILPHPKAKLDMRVIKAPLVASMKIFPGINASILDSILSQPINGLILSTYGSGNIPDNDPKLLDVIYRATQRGVLIINVTQCRHGSVNMGNYATGNVLAERGVISGVDMTHEAALAKLYYLCSTDDSPSRIKAKMSKSLRGELTPID